MWSTQNSTLESAITVNFCYYRPTLLESLLSMCHRGYMFQSPTARNRKKPDAWKLLWVIRAIYFLPWNTFKSNGCSTNLVKETFITKRHGGYILLHGIRKNIFKIVIYALEPNLVFYLVIHMSLLTFFTLLSACNVLLNVHVILKTWYFLYNFVSDFGYIKHVIFLKNACFCYFFFSFPHGLTILG